jgi:hypothetical protein
LFKSTVYNLKQKDITNHQLVELRRLQARPSGCSFLGARAVSIPARIMHEEGTEFPIIIDSGSDITLISEQAWKALDPLPKKLTGRKINLIQVTGKATIQGYVKLPLFFTTTEGPVKLEVEAYVVKGMSTPLILGNDFADQYELSVIRQEGNTKVILGSSLRSIDAQSSTGNPQINEQGQAFKVTFDAMSLKGFERQREHRRNKARRKKDKRDMHDEYIRSFKKIRIPAETSKRIPVDPKIFREREIIYAERLFTVHRNADEFFAAPDSIISREYPFLHVSNFSKEIITIDKGQPIGRAFDPSTFLDSRDSLNEETKEKYHAHAAAIKAISEEMKIRSAHDEYPHLVGDEPLEGGPKTAESPPEDVAANDLLKEVNFSPDLSAEQKVRLEGIILKNVKAFGVDGRLGNYPAKVDIRLKSEAKPVSLPPFPLSPVNREIMDQQIDKWIRLEVIEPSNSPWGAPTFISYRNGKPRMVIDYRKLNDQVIPDEFPLPKQEDILQSLTGSQWLTTLDALAGFTQLEMSEDSKEYTAFRSHRGLYQFRRLPFGYRNGPSAFQRVMQDILAPFLWIFTLVYIDDIVIFSKNFEDHTKHVDRVLLTVSKAGITLSPSKCHFGFQSLQLLGQKVSRLGLATHRSKIDAINQLKEPTNVKELQTFLGMMVYFSAYIPYYAWIVAPLFKLLKKGTTWRWTILEQEAFELSKKVLTNAPVRAFAIPGRGYRLYTDACDYGLGAILQQVQPIKIKDLRGTKVYEKLKKAYQEDRPVPKLVNDIDDLEPLRKKEEIDWDKNFEETEVEVERVIAYWSRTLKSAERNYSPTEREALALKEGLIKFQAYIEGERIYAITDHAALTWSKTYQNINRRLLSWGTIFAAYPNMKIVHRAGRVHSNVDPISRLRRRVPVDDGPMAISLSDENKIALDLSEDPLTNLFSGIDPNFESKVLLTAGKFQECEEKDPPQTLSVKRSIRVPHQHSSNESSIVLEEFVPSIRILNNYFNQDELDEWKKAYLEDKFSARVIESKRNEIDSSNSFYPQYFLSDEGLMYFEDWEGQLRLYVPKGMRSRVLREDHEELTEGAHSGAHRSYYRLACTYYWPRMYRDIKEYVRSCDICQKVKPKKHSPYGLLTPLAIPSRPFDTITMDFIPELPLTKSGFNNILVVVDKLTKFVVLIPTTTRIDAKETASLIYNRIVCRFGLPKEVITDRDSRWTSSFWKEICRQMNIRRGMSSAYHPQSDGQMEVMNQVLEIALRCYVGVDRDDWDCYLNGFSLSYNNTPHSATKYAPAFLLYGYLPRTNNNKFRLANDVIDRAPDHANHNPNFISDLDADHTILELESHRLRAKECLVESQALQKRNYNKGRIVPDIEVGDKILLNLKSLRLTEPGESLGKKLIQLYDGPFEVTEKLSNLSYRVKLPSSYRIHNVLNIAHLEKYHESTSEWGARVKREAKREALAETEWEVDRIVGEKYRRKGTRRVPYYRVRYTGYGPEQDEWIPRSWLRNAPDILKDWESTRKT